MLAAIDIILICLHRIKHRINKISLSVLIQSDHSFFITSELFALVKLQISSLKYLATLLLYKAQTLPKDLVSVHTKRKDLGAIILA